MIPFPSFMAVLFPVMWTLVALPIAVLPGKLPFMHWLVALLIVESICFFFWFFKDIFAVWGGREIAPSEKCSSDQRPPQFTPLFNKSGGVGMDEFGKERLRILESERWEGMYAWRPYKTPDGWAWFETIEWNMWPGACLPGFGFGADSHYYRKSAGTT